MSHEEKLRIILINDIRKADWLCGQLTYCETRTLFEGRRILKEIIVLKDCIIAILKCMTSVECMENLISSTMYFNFSLLIGRYL